MLSRVLSPTAERQLAETRTLLADLGETLTSASATDQDKRTLSRAVAQLDDLFLLVVVGEFNAGKSAFVNALVGERLLDEGVTPTTSRIHLLRHGEQRTSELSPAGLQVVTAPVDMLRDVHIVDTPGTNAIMREHEQLTADFVPRSDLVIFITSSDRPFTETERAFLETIRDWGKKIVLIVNKVDIFERPEELEDVLTFVRRAATELLGTTPEIFPVSARLAWLAKHGAPANWAASRFEHLERYIRDTLDDGTRFRLKLANPLGVGDAWRGVIFRSRRNGSRCWLTTSRRWKTWSGSSPAIPGSGAWLCLTDDWRREGAPREGSARPPILRGHAAHHASRGPAEPGACAA